MTRGGKVSRVEGWGPGREGGRMEQGLRGGPGSLVLGSLHESIEEPRDPSSHMLTFIRHMSV